VPVAGNVYQKINFVIRLWLLPANHHFKLRPELHPNIAIYITVGYIYVFLDSDFNKIRRRSHIYLRKGVVGLDGTTTQLPYGEELVK
jgi:hypothetical protein